MVKDLIMSFKDNVDQRAKNPFLGTFLMVWIIRNWELVYTLFNFDDEHKLDFKVQFIKKYYENFSFWSNFLGNTWWSLSILILSYLLLNISRLVVNFSEKKIKPQVYKITDKTSIVTKEELDIVRNSRNEIQNRLNDERDSKANLESRLKNLESTNSDLSQTISLNNTNFEATLNEKKEQEQLLKSEIVELNKKLEILKAEANDFDGKQINWMNKEVEYVEQISGLKKDRNDLFAAKTKIEEQVKIDTEKYMKEINVMNSKLSKYNKNRERKEDLLLMDFESSVRARAKNYNIVNDLEKNNIVHDSIIIIDYKFGKKEFQKMIENHILTNTENNKSFIDFSNSFGIVDSKNSISVLTPFGERIFQKLINI